ncbi:MAG: dTDP-4-dehydrorhamnose reductase [Pyrinomonas sp.]|uniref:dTDP-4-dehydrorhamnose reductase n=1 Tax=Pyrinomonas sp. TaxID=2080306 RepID=UPI003333E3B5
MHIENSPRKVLITGAGGMVGKATAAYCRALGDEVRAFDRQTLDITDEEAVARCFDEVRPEAVINCAAWTDVDGCELDPERAHRVNAQAPERLARHCRRVGALLVTISTDYVFDGTKSGFYTQRDDPNPQSVYARAKLDGERRAMQACARTMVVRTGWIFGLGGKNFLSKIIELTERGERLKAIRDSWGTPTYANDLARRLRELAALDLPGIYHVVNSGKGASYEQFARETLALAGLEAEIASVSFADLKRPAPRPQNSRLRCLLSEAIGLAPLPDWRDALARFVAATRTAS